jgi:uncharacterized protein (DUF58 family)
MELNKKQFTAYILTVLICLWYIFGVNKAFGFPFLAVLLIVPAVSYVTLKFSKISAAVSLSQNAVYKGEEVVLTVTVECGRVLFPAPFIHIALFDGEERVISASRGRPGVLTKNYRAERWGTLRFGVKTLELHDYIGLFALIQPTKELKQNAHVYPSIYDPQKNDLLEFYRDAMLNDEEEERQSEAQTFSKGPGYEFRPYIPGDPLNRISWKLFARHGQYMVRKDEYIKNKDIALILDRRGSGPETEERMVEAVLAMLSSMVKQGIHCTVHYFSDNVWQEFAVENRDNITALQVKFLTYTFVRGNTGLPPERPEGLPVVFTCSPDSGLFDEFSKGGETLAVCPEGSAVTGFFQEGRCWVVNDAYDFHAF